MTKVTTSDFQKGMFIEYKNEPHQITELQFVNPGKGSAFVRTKLKSLNTGRVQEFTYKSGESAEEVSINVREMQYLYKQEPDLIFMDNSSYEQYNLPKEKTGNFYNFMKEGETYQLLILDGQAVGMRYPKKVVLKVTEADDAVAKGNTVMGAKKPVKVETGVEVLAPLFIKVGDLISVDPSSGEYIERVSMK